MWYRNMLSLVIDYLINFPPPSQIRFIKAGTIKMQGGKKKDNLATSG